MQESKSVGAKRLVLVRHAKAQAHGPSDHERALTGRGRADAAGAGRWLREQAIEPDAALVSDAVRAQETWAEMSTGAAWGIEPELSAALYESGSDSTFDLLRETPVDVATLVVVGHNPTMAYLAELIDDGEGDEDAITALASQGYPTCALTVFAVAGAWSELGPGSGTVELFHVGGS